MKIALIGYGKMGKAIERIALSRGHEIVCRIDKDNIADFDSPEFKGADVAIEFTMPATGRQNVERCLRLGVPVVSGTTGWNNDLPQVQDICRQLGGAMVWASNYSIGVNIFMAINRKLAAIMDAFPEYKPHLVETHHIHKLDHPSGTAVSLAEDIIKENSHINGWAEPDGSHREAPDVLPVDHIRTGEVPGIHTICWDSPADSITITHSAKNRDGFALGAVIAAEWLPGNPGVHSMKEILSDISGYDNF